MIRASAIAALVSLAFGLAMPARAFAQTPPSLALTGHFIAADGDFGGGAVLDVWAAFDSLRLGGFFGAAAIPSERDSNNRVMMPFGLSGAVVFGSDVTFELRVRAGAWGGATQAEKLLIAPFAGGGAYLGWSLGAGATITLGLDAWAVIGSDAWRMATSEEDATSATVAAIAPGIGLAWSPPAEETFDPESDEGDTYQ